MTPAPKPIVLVPACNRLLGHHPFHVAGKKYVDFVRLAGCLPLVVTTAEPEEFDALLDLAHGVLLTGSPSNVHPRHFGEGVADETLPLDEARDAWTLPLIPRVLERGLPLFAICRGAQEVNVALGGSLYQQVHAAGPYRDHRADNTAAAEVQSGPAPEVVAEPGSRLAGIVDEAGFSVNSVHGQAVSRLADGARIEARAPDGLIEAFTLPAKGFNLCVQWHPEWQAAGNPVSMKLAAAFGAACARYRNQRQDQREHQRDGRDRHRPPEA